jgi:hypothetical protein
LARLSGVLPLSPRGAAMTGHSLPVRMCNRMGLFMNKTK